jgi:hypothetical protein
MPSVPIHSVHVRLARRCAGFGLAVASLAIPSGVFAADAGNAFNPKISLILDGEYAHYSNDSDATVPGVLLGSETGLLPAGLSLGESELVIEANIDDLFHGWTTLSLAPEGGVSVEEAYINTLSLPEGLLLKFGRFFSDIGYQNHQHAHAWEFADAPLVYRALLGTQLGDDGLQLRWLAPLPVFLELGGELFRGAAFPGGGEQRSGISGKTAFVHLGDDLGPSWSYRLGFSYLATNSSDRRTGEDVETSFTGSSRVAGLDFIAKWSPDGNPRARSAVIQGEYFRRRENGDVVSDPDGGADFSGYRGTQSGFYLQGVYKFIPMWRAGLRYDRLMADNMLDNPAPGTSLELLADNSDDPRRWSAMVDWSHSEFSRLRLQFNRDQSRPNGEIDNQVFVQYIFALGSHPAHQF